MHRPPDRSRVNMAHTRQSKPDASLGFQVKVLQSFKDVSCSLRSGTHREREGEEEFWGLDKQLLAVDVQLHCRVLRVWHCDLETGGVGD
jgi:hypothetical protein